MPRKFFMVIQKNGGRAIKRHETLQLATDEAERLVRESCQPFYVLEAVYYLSYNENPLIITPL